MSTLEDYNYYGDARTHAAWARKPYTITQGPTTKGRVTVTFVDSMHELLCENGIDVPQEMELLADWQVCPICRGNGTVVDPRVDSSGLTQEDFDHMGLDFEESYKRGDYNITCPACSGRNVIPKVTFPEDVQKCVTEWENDEAEYRQQQLWELQVGC